MERLRRHLSYANVMASVAVFLALGGVGYAAVTINGKDIENRTIAAKKLKEHTLTATEINLSTLGYERRARWALVDASGAIVAQSGGIKVSSSTFSTGGGEIYLDFGTKVVGKAIIATPAEKFTDSGEATVQMAPCGSGSQGADCPTGTNDAHHVYLLTTNGLGGGEAPEGFYVAVLP